MCEPCAGHGQHKEEEGYKGEHGTKSRARRVGKFPSDALSVHEGKMKGRGEELCE